MNIKNILITAIISSFIGGCAAGVSVDTGNTCASPGATYIATFTRASGDCFVVPNMPDALVLVDDAGNIRELYDMQADVSCVEVTADACQTSLGTCDFVYNRDAYVVGADLAFSADGKTGTGTQTVAVYAADGTTCSGEFNVALTRQ